MAHQGDADTPDERESVQELLKEVREHAEEAVRKLDEVSQHVEPAGEESIGAIDRGGFDTGHPHGGPQASDLPTVEGIDVGDYDKGNPGGGPK